MCTLCAASEFSRWHLVHTIHGFLLDTNVIRSVYHSYATTHNGHDLCAVNRPGPSVLCRGEAPLAGHAAKLSAE